MVKNLIIVCEEKFKVYGDYLAQLISLEDDTEDKQIGVKDGAVKAQVWTEKDYKSNAAKFSSDQFVLFIGEGKLIKEKSSHMKSVTSELGMIYSKLGKQATLSVDKVVSMNDYESFIEIAKKYQDNIEILYDKNIEKKKKLLEMAGAGIIAFPAGLLNAVPITIGLNLVNKITQNKKIKSQQYSCLVTKFYLDFLNDFLGM